MKTLNFFLLLGLFSFSLNTSAQSDSLKVQSLSERMSGSWDVHCSEGDNTWRLDSTGAFEELELACEGCLSFQVDEFGKWVAHDNELHITVLGRKVNNVISIFDHQVTVHYKVEFQESLIKLTPVFLKGESEDKIVDHYMYDILFLKRIE